MQKIERENKGPKTQSFEITIDRNEKFNSFSINPEFEIEYRGLKLYFCKHCVKYKTDFYSQNISQRSRVCASCMYSRRKKPD